MLREKQMNMSRSRVLRTIVHNHKVPFFVTYPSILIVHSVPESPTGSIEQPWITPPGFETTSPSHGWLDSKCNAYLLGWELPSKHEALCSAVKNIVAFINLILCSIPGWIDAVILLFDCVFVLFLVVSGKHLHLIQWSVRHIFIVELLRACSLEQMLALQYRRLSIVRFATRRSNIESL